jgi:quercetin dioxygenase-like cupin family protein
LLKGHLSFMSIKQSSIHVTRWHGSQHPTFSIITREMKKEGLRPYMWSNMPNHRYGVRSHGYDKVLYVVEGVVEITLPDSNQRMNLCPGDRVDIPAGVRHGTIVGATGAKCVEAAVAR